MNEIITIAKALVALGCLYSEPDYSKSIGEEIYSNLDNPRDYGTPKQLALYRAEDGVEVAKFRLAEAKKELECEKLEEKMVKAVNNAK